MIVSSETHLKVLNAYRRYIRGDMSYMNGLTDHEADVLKLVIDNMSIKNAVHLSKKTGLPIWACADIVVVNTNINRNKTISSPVIEKDSTMTRKPRAIRRQRGKNVKTDKKPDIIQTLKLLLHGTSVHELKNMGITLTMIEKTKRFLRLARSGVCPQTISKDIGLDDEYTLKMLNVWNEHKKRWGLQY